MKLINIFLLFNNEYITQPYSLRKSHHHKKGEAEGLTTICLRGCATSPPPACLTKSAGDRRFPWRTHCCEFVVKITPITNLMCGGRNNQATKKQSVWNNYKHKSKVENSEREKKREHKRIC